VDGAAAWSAAVSATRHVLRAYPWLDRDDVLSDACLGATLALHTYDPHLGSLDVHIFYRAWRTALDGIRQRAPLTRDGYPRDGHQASLDAMLTTIPHPRAPEAEQAVDDRDQLRRILAALPPEMAAVLRAYDLTGRTLLDIAREMGVSESQVCKLRKKALALARTV
jgi:RNA polymerase sigma factor (sigma-70 family)